MANPRLRLPKNASAAATRDDPLNESSERKAPLATTGIHVPLAHMTAPPLSRSAPRLLQCVSARLNAMSVRWPSRASDAVGGVALVSALPTNPRPLIGVHDAPPRGRSLGWVRHAPAQRSSKTGWRGASAAHSSSVESGVKQ